MSLGLATLGGKTLVCLMLLSGSGACLNDCDGQYVRGFMIDRSLPIRVVRSQMTYQTLLCSMLASIKFNLTPDHHKNPRSVTAYFDFAQLV